MFKFLMTASVRLIQSQCRSHRSFARPALAKRLKRKKYFDCQQLEDRINPVTVTNVDNWDFANNKAFEGSLYEAILIANGSSTDNKIDFKASVFGASSFPIELNKSLPEITESVTIVGNTDKSYVKIDGQGDFKAIVTASSGVTVTLTDITIRNTILGTPYLFNIV